MSDLIFKTKGKETFRIPFRTPGIKCPETKLEIKKMTETDISKVLIEGEYATIMGVKYKRVEEPKTPVEEAYKEWWGQYPELETDSKYDDMRWQGFQAGYELAQPKAVPVEEPKPKMEYQESGTVDKVEYNGHTYLRIDYDNDSWYGGVWWKQIERHKSPMNVVFDNETRNILEGLWFDQVKKGVLDEPTKPMDEVVERLTKKYQAQKLYHRLYDELGYNFEDIENVVSLVEDWLPEPQSAEGSQNVNTELLVDGFNHCLQKMKEMLR